MDYSTMTTKQIGNIGEVKTLAKFVELGIPVYLPFGDNEKADLVADFNGKLNRIQIKTSLKAEDGKMIFSLVSSTVHRKNGVKHIYDNNEIDYFVLYNIERDVLLLLSINEPDLPKENITIRYTEPKSRNQYRSFMENEYLLETVIAQLQTISN